MVKFPAIASGVSRLAIQIAAAMNLKQSVYQPNKVRSGERGDKYRGPSRPGRKEKHRPKTEFKARATPSGKPDLRHDKYLHSVARGWRRALWAPDNPGEPYPFDKPDYQYVQRP